MEFVEDIEKPRLLLALHPSAKMNFSPPTLAVNRPTNHDSLRLSYRNDLAIHLPKILHNDGHPPSNLLKQITQKEVPADDSLPVLDHRKDLRTEQAYVGHGGLVGHLGFLAVHDQVIHPEGVVQVG